MYRYDHYDHALVRQRVEQFRDQVERRVSGELSEDEFKPLRLRNGLYLQRHAYMLRVAIPYGLVSADQLRLLAFIAREYDRGYGHFTTRQNIQYNWPELEDVPEILQQLALVEMHAIQTSGNCIRNITSDPLAGVAEDELEDPRPYCEILRQWSTLHPEFSWLPRKFKIAVTGATEDRAAVLLHDIGLRLVCNERGELGFRVFVGGGMLYSVEKFGTDANTGCYLYHKDAGNQTVAKEMGAGAVPILTANRVLTRNGNFWQGLEITAMCANKQVRAMKSIRDLRCA